MNKRFDSVRHTPLGQQLIALVDVPNRMIEFKAFSREGFPAVTALVSEASALLEGLRKTDKKLFNFAKQFVGDLVGAAMRDAGFKKVQDQKAVPGKLFTVGAVWAPA